jgi:short/branched chain acyl-CoA dehydrogenase
MTCDTPAMDFDLPDEHVTLRGTVRAFAENVIAPVAEEIDRERRFPVDIIRQLAGMGLLGVPVPAEHGGAGSDTLAYAIVVEELARVDSSVAITVAAHTSLGTMPILLHGSADQRARWLPDLASGRRLGAFGLTEAGAGSDAGATRTRAAEQPDGSFVVDGEKMFITNAGTPLSGLVTVTALTGDGEISALVVENGTPGYEPGPPLRKIGWHASDTRPGRRFNPADW